MTDWHLQAFGEWLTCLFPRAAVGHCVGQREWPPCGFFGCLLSVNALLDLSVCSFVLCAQMCFTQYWIMELRLGTYTLISGEW